MELINVILVLAESFSFVIGVFGNSVVIYVKTREKKLRRQTNFYVLSITIANLIAGLFVIPRTIYTVSGHFIFRVF